MHVNARTYFLQHTDIIIKNKLDIKTAVTSLIVKAIISLTKILRPIIGKQIFTEQSPWIDQIFDKTHRMCKIFVLRKFRKPINILYKFNFKP